MAYDDLKEHDGDTYTGVRVGDGHDWRYPHGRWREAKTAPDRWRVTFTADKHRQRPAPPGSGADVDTRYHWYLIAHQRVRKLDKDTYATRLEGHKFKLGHRRPAWRRFSYAYDDQPGLLALVIDALETRLEEVRARRSDGQTPLEAFARDRSSPGEGV